MAKTSTRRRLLGFDSEDDGQGNPFLWCFTHSSGSWWTRHRGDALQYLENFGRAAGDKAEAWATNLEYDLVNLFGPERIAEVALRFGRSALVGASWRKVELRDTFRHVPYGVAQLGEALGFRKVESDLFDGKPRTFARYLRRCQRDAAITFRAARRFHALYRGFREHARMTLAGTALAVWRERHWKRPVFRPESEVWHAALEAYHGGRTQVFSVGRFEQVTVLDVASMFPWAMTAGALPIPWGLYRRVGPRADLERTGLYRVKVRCLEVPTLPVRTPEGTVYPRGEWEAWYVGEEIAYARERGTECRVLEGYTFLEHARPFDSYVRVMYRKKQAARGLDRTLYKLMLNALYGKFGQQGHVVRAVPLARLPELKHPPEEWRAWNGLAIFSVEGTPPPWGNNVWPAIITARARVKLARMMQRLAARGCRVLYCDTDSVFFTGNGGRIPERARRIGDFERRGVYCAAVLVGKKEYGLDAGRGTWDLFAKGVPYAEREAYLEHGIADFSRPTRLRESARNGEQANVWRRVRKVRRLNLNTRARADGSLPVPEVWD